MKINFLALLLSIAFVNLCFAQEVGWRTDGTGKYPNANPPTEWAADKNVIWSTELPSWSNATLVVVGDKIFVCAEPATLICVNADDGKILWQKTNTYQDICPQDIPNIEKAEKLYTQYASTENRLRKLKQKLAASDPKPADIKQKEELTEKLKSLKEELAPLEKWGSTKPHKLTGYSSATPASDGKVVCVLYATGIVACYDLDGNMKWGRLLQKFSGQDNRGVCTSPQIRDGKLLVQIKDLFALDLADGKTLWQSKVTPHFGSIIPAAIGSTQVALMPGGEIIKISDGKIIGQLPALEYNSSAIDAGVVYSIQPKATAHALDGKAVDKIETSKIWETTLSKKRYYASPLIHEGLVYCVNQEGLLTVLDIKDGKVAYEKKLPVGSGTAYPSPTLAGNYIYISNDNGTTVVIMPGRQYKEIVINKLPEFRSCPVFVGSRVYIKTLEKLFCIGK